MTNRRRAGFRKEQRDWHYEALELSEDGDRSGEIDLPMEIEGPGDSHLEAHDKLSCAPESENDAAFREKIKSIMFPGRGKADRSKSISRHGKDVSNADRERRARH